MSGCSVSLNTRTTLQYIDYSILLVTELICQDLRLFESDDSLGHHRNDGNDGDYDDDDVDDDGSCDDDDGDAGDGDDDEMVIRTTFVASTGSVEAQLTLLHTGAIQLVSA